jgi:hypothetical protein
VIKYDVSMTSICIIYGNKIQRVYCLVVYMFDKG